jgi:hypothetical protein
MEKQSVKRNSYLAAGRLPLAVDYTKTLIEMIEAGKYDIKHESIVSKNFPVPENLLNRKITTSSRLFCFHENFNSEEAEAAIKKYDYSPANLFELLTFGYLYPNLQRAFPIIALETVWRNPSSSLYVPGLATKQSHRSLDLFTLKGIWPSNCRFLSVKYQNE